LGNVLSYSNTGLGNGATYYYKVTAVNSIGEGSFSNEATATTWSIPGAPQSLTAVGGNQKIDLSWTAASSGGSSVTNYKVYRGPTSGSETLLTTLGNVLSYSNTGLGNGATYYYKVTAVNSVGEGPYSNEATAATWSIPGAPLYLTAVGGAHKIDLSWLAPASSGGATITAYKIYRGPTSGSETPLIQIPVGATSTYSDTGLTTGATFFYKVTAVNSMGEGPYSNEAGAIVPSPPSAPQNLIATSTGGIGSGPRITLTWDASASNGGSQITVYNIYRGTTPNSETYIDNMPNGVYNYRSTGLAGGTTYYYKMTAVNCAGESVFTNEVSATTESTPSAPQNLQATASGDDGLAPSITISWSAPASDGGARVAFYSISRGSTSNSETFLLHVGSATLSYTDSGLSGSTTYYYKVQAENYVGDGAYSSEASATTRVPVPAPQSCSAYAGTGKITLSWTAPVSDGGSAISGYKIYRGPSFGAETYYASVSGSTLTFDDTGVADWNMYYYYATAVNAYGEGPRSDESYATTISVPGAPDGLSASTTYELGHIMLTWTFDASKSGGSPVSVFNVYRSTAPGQETLLFSGTFKNTRYLDTNVIAGTIYYYKVSGTNAVGEGLKSNEVSATPPTVPTAPLNPAAVGGNGYVTLSFNAPSSDGGSPVTSYNIYRCVNYTGTEVFYASVSGGTLTFTDSNVPNWFMYGYEVTAVNAAGESVRSEEVFASPLSVPGHLWDLSVQPGNGNNLLSWWVDHNSYGGSFIYWYGIYRGTASGQETLLNTISARLGHWVYDDTAVTPGTTYYYKMTAINGIGESAFSNEASGMPYTVPTAPSITSAGGGNGIVTLTFSAPSSDGYSLITSYNVYRSTNNVNFAVVGTAGPTQTTYTDTGLTNGVTYYYKMSAVNAAGEGPQSSAISAVPGTAPNAPLSLTATAGPMQVTLGWTAPPNNGYAITSYSVYRSTTSGGETKLGSSTTTSYADTAVTAGTKYYYKVTAVNAKGGSGFSNEASATPTVATVPGAPQNLAAVSAANGISLTWSAPASNGGSQITSYQIFRGTRSGGEGSTAYASVGGGILNYVDTGATKGTKYFYNVKAVNSVGKSPASNEVSCTWTTVPTAPQNLQASPGNGQITLSWTAPSSNGGSTVTNYRLYRGSVSGEEIYLTQVSGTTLTYTNTGLTNGQTYYYKVTAVNAVGEGSSSNEASAAPTSATKPTAPQNLKAVAVAGKNIDLSWAAPSSDGGYPITGYKIYRSTSSGKEIYKTTVTTLTFRDSGLKAGTKYYYKVSAVNAIGEGPLSAEASATAIATGLPAVPNAPIDGDPGVVGYLVVMVCALAGAIAGIVYVVDKARRKEESGGRFPDTRSLKHLPQTA
jgi:fibronectin type 3 domain-containing protein